MKEKHNQHEMKGLEQKSKQLEKACQKLESDLHKRNIDAKTLHKDCEEICRIGHECEGCCQKMQ